MKRRVTEVLLFSNAVYWLLFFGYFFVVSKPFNPQALEVDLPRPFYVIANRALSPLQEHEGIGFRATYIVQAPSICAARPVVWVINRKADLWDRTFVGTSPGGYLLIAEAVISFVQWFLIGSLVTYVISKLRSRSGRKNRQEVAK